MLVLLFRTVLSEVLHKKKVWTIPPVLFGGSGKP